MKYQPKIGEVTGLSQTTIGNMQDGKNLPKSKNPPRRPAHKNGKNLPKKEDEEFETALMQATNAGRRSLAWEKLITQPSAFACAVSAGMLGALARSPIQGAICQPANP